MPEFSVIIPTYQEEGTIGKTLERIERAKRLSGLDVETIVVDGGSTDRTVERARKSARVINFGEKCIPKARNLGAKISSGTILVFIDADVNVPENFFTSLNTVFKNKEIAGANCNVMPSEEVNPTPFEKKFYSLWSFLRWFFYKIKPCGTGENGIIVRRGVFEKVNGFREELNTIEDLDFVFRASREGRFLYLRNITITETIRRFRKLGFPRFCILYLSNFFYYLFTKKTSVNEWRPVR